MKKKTIWVYVWSVVMLIVIGLTACNQVKTAESQPAAPAEEKPLYFEDAAEPAATVESPAEVQPPEDTLDSAGQGELYVEQGNVRIRYDASIESVVDDAGSVIPAASEEAAYMPVHPEVADFDFSPMQAHIYVASVDEYEQIADFAPGLIADLSRLIEGADTFGDCVYELPLDVFYHECVHQEFVANPKRISFANGSGVRFVTVYAIQDLAPVGNDNLVYVFQGFTADRRYYVKAVVELMHAQLEGQGEIPMDVYTAMDAETVNAYFNQFAQMMDQSEEDFTPKLDWIDSVIAQLSIQPSS